MTNHIADLSTAAQPASPAEATPLPRRRGGQPGNQNARTHGFYSTAFPPEEQESFQQAIALKDLAAEIAFMRVKLLQMAAYPDTPPDLLLQAVRALARLASVQHTITRW